MVSAAERGRDNREPLVMENANKTDMAEVAKISSAINLSNKYSLAISNADIYAATNLGLTGIKKYLRCIGQI